MSESYTKSAHVLHCTRHNSPSASIQSQMQRGSIPCIEGQQIGAAGQQQVDHVHVPPLARKMEGCLLTPVNSVNVHKRLLEKERNDCNVVVLRVGKEGRVRRIVRCE